MASKQHILGQFVAQFSHRAVRIRDRIEDWQRYFRNPSELFHKYAAQKRAICIMERPEVRKALAAAQKERERLEPGTRSKYTNIQGYLSLNLRRIYALGLHKNSSLAVLDVGAGAGFFMYLCKLFGHTVTGFDANRESFYREMHDALGVPCQHLFVLPNTPLPDFGTKFDLITAFAVCFHKTANRTWSAEEWRFFCRNLLDKHCKDDGRILLHLNDFPPGDRLDVCVKVRASFPEAVLGYHSISLRKTPEEFSRS